MKVYYDKETDSLYIDLSGKAGVDADEVSPGIVLDFDSDRNVVGIDIQHASSIVDLDSLTTEFLPTSDPDAFDHTARPDS
jgi:uncharacterized protein YuzE